MKKLTLVLIFFVMWYFGGMFRQPLLMAAALGGIAVMTAMTIFSAVISRKAGADFRIKNTVCRKGYEKSVEILTSNKGILPINKMQLSVNAAYVRYPGIRLKKKFYCAAASKKHNKENLTRLYITPPYCGRLRLSIPKLAVFDWLGIFSFRRKNSAQSDVYVFPPDRNISLSRAVFGAYEGDPVTEENSDVAGEDHSEIKQIREYRPGDLYKHIHRNYSAKTDSVWIKEFKKENDLVFDFLLDTSCDVRPDIYSIDAFYDILYNITSALTSFNACMRMHYYNNEKKLIESFTVSDKESLGEFFITLYDTELLCSTEDFRSAPAVLSLRGMVLDLSLRWGSYGRKVYTFSKTNYEQELQSTFFSV